MRARLEPFGAWVSPSDGLLLAVEIPLARRLGLEGGPLWNPGARAPERPLEVHVSVGQRCPMSCDGCYQSAGPQGGLRSGEELRATLRSIAEQGAFQVAFGGGEPLAHPELAELGHFARSLGLAPVFTTSGLGLDEARAATLSAFAQVNVSHDGADGGYREVRGFDAASHAEQALEVLRSAGLRTGLNMVLTRSSFAFVERTAERALELGAKELQLLRYKPAGRGAGIEYLTRRLARAQRRALWPLLRTLHERYSSRLSVRIDCALVPLLSDELAGVSSLEKLGVWGCEAGRHLGAVDHRGASSRCSFLGEDQGFAQPLAQTLEPCEGCAVRSVCRGGCRVITRRLAGRELGDPECPRVERFEGRGE